MSLALAVILAATLSAAPGFSVEGVPPPDTGTDAPPVAAPMGEASLSSEDEAILLSMDSAKEAFGISDRNGTGTVDAFTTYLDIQTGVVWVPVFRDDQALLGQVQQQGQVVPAASLESDSDSVAVRISDYTHQEVESALAQMADIIGLRGATVAFSFNPMDDAIEAVGSPAGFELLGDSVSGVRISYTVSEETLRTNHNNGSAPPYKGGALIIGQGLGSTADALCTSGIPARNASGTPGLFTAGHCFALSAQIYANTNKLPAFNAGKVTHSYTFPTTDAQFISGKTYTGSIFSSSGTATIKPVKGTYYPAAGYGNPICFVGTISASNCTNNVAQYGSTACDASGCSTNLMRLSGGIIANPGDSGGPVFANFGNTVKVSGITLGTMY